MSVLGDFFGWIMQGCYRLTADYGLTILLFTVISKVILMPVSVIVQRNSIKMVKMYPEINRIKSRYWGNKDMESEELYRLYKKEKYNPLLDLIPIFVQLFLLMGVVSAFSSEKMLDIQRSDPYLWGLDLSVVPARMGGNMILVPVLAALSAWFMCYGQNKLNVLQSEQSKANQWITLSVSVALSLYLGFFVAAGIGLYWIFGNLLSVVVTWLLNLWMDPKKYIDYEALEESRRELDQVLQFTGQKKQQENREYAAREKADYKRFMKYGEKQLVFYSEKNGFYKYFRDVIEVILRRTDIVIHYVTGDPCDEVFALQNDQFRVYYIGENKLIVLMMKLEADMVIMTMPDLHRYHIKRSMVKNDIEYVYMDHGIGSVNMLLRKHALDHFDTIFVANDVAYNEIRGQEKQYGLKKKNIVRCGFGLIDRMIAEYESAPKPQNSIPRILIAPSWQQDNLLDLCIDRILDQLLGKGYQVIVRPHPQYVRHFQEKLLALQDKYAEYNDFLLQMDFAANDTVFHADILMTDWSGIGYEYSFTTLKPTLFINTPMKVINPDYEEIGVEPFDLLVRDRMGISVELDQLDTLQEVVHKLLSDESYSVKEMERIRGEFLYNIGHSGKVGADYIINRLIEYSKK